VDLLLAGDEDALLGGLLRERARCGAWWRTCDYLGQALARLGERWRNGEVRVIDEHQASELLIRAMVRAAESLPRPTEGAPTCILTTAIGEDHTLALLFADLVLREAGWRPRWCGKMTPAVELAEYVANGNVQLVALSASSNAADAERLAAEVATLLPVCARRGIGLILGGDGAWPESRPGCHRIRSFRTFAEILEAELVGRT
jgi:hypothetical protein